MRRLERVLDFAARKLDTLVQQPPAGIDAHAAGAWQLQQKVVAETAMLLWCAAPVARVEASIRRRIDALARRLLPFARSEDVASAICLDPGMACDHAVAHVLLGRLGFRDVRFDALLDEALALCADFGPERLAHRRLEREWIARLRGRTEALRSARVQCVESLLHRPLDVLAATRMDVYAFTHAVMYASDFGLRRAPPARSRRAIADDAECALAFALDERDFDLAAEVLLAWPMLRLRWDAVPDFALATLLDAFDDNACLPGLAYDPGLHADADASARERHRLATCYHATYVMGFLLASLLQAGMHQVRPLPQTTDPCVAAGDAWRIVAGAAARQRTRAHLHRLVGACEPSRRDALAHLLLAVELRHAVAAADLPHVRDLLAIALDCRLLDGAAPRQALALLRRCSVAQAWLAGRAAATAPHSRDRVPQRPPGAARIADAVAAST